MPREGEPDRTSGRSGGAERSRHRGARRFGAFRAADRHPDRSGTDRRACLHHALRRTRGNCRRRFRRHAVARTVLAPHRPFVRAHRAGLTQAFGGAAHQLCRRGVSRFCADRSDRLLRQPLSARSRHFDRHLHDARLRAEHRRRSRRPARSRLRRLLCGRCVFLRADRAVFRPVVLDLLAACRHSRCVRRNPAWLSGAAPARRLPGYCDARLRRDHPSRPAQLAKPDRRPKRHSGNSAAVLFRLAVQCIRTWLCRRRSGFTIRRRTALCFFITSFSRWRC